MHSSSPTVINEEGKSENLALAGAGEGGGKELREHQEGLPASPRVSSGEKGERGKEEGGRRKEEEQMKKILEDSKKMSFLDSAPEHSVSPPVKTSGEQEGEGETQEASSLNEAQMADRLFSILQQLRVSTSPEDNQTQPNTHTQGLTDSFQAEEAVTPAIDENFSRALQQLFASASTEVDVGERGEGAERGPSHCFTPPSEPNELVDGFVKNILPGLRTSRPMSANAADFHPSSHSTPLLDSMLRPSSAVNMNMSHPGLPRPSPNNLTSIPPSVSPFQERGRGIMGGGGGSDSIWTPGGLHSMPQLTPGTGPPLHAYSHITGGNGSPSGSHEVSIMQLPNGPLTAQVLQGKVCNLACDRNGSRLLQKELQHTSPEVIEVIVQECTPELQRLMCDTYANYMCQHLFQAVSASQRLEMLEALATSKVMLAVAEDKKGTHSLQGLFQHMSSLEEEMIVERTLRGHVLSMALHPCATHVLQQLVTCMRHCSDFIFQEVSHRMTALSVDPSGLGVVKKCISAAESRGYVQPFLKVIEDCAFDFSEDPYANYAVQHALECWGGEKCSKLLSILKQRVQPMATHKYASNVVEMALKVSPQETRHEFIRGFDFPDEYKLHALMRSAFACFVVATAIDMSPLDEVTVIIAYLKRTFIRLQDGRSRTKWEKVISDAEKKWRKAYSATTGTPIEQVPPIPAAPSTAPLLEEEARAGPFSSMYGGMGGMGMGMGGGNGMEFGGYPRSSYYSQS